MVLVFDLDQTLVDTDTVFRIASEKGTIDSDELNAHLNIRLIEEVLKPAVQLKGQTVSAIILLSNNNDNTYVNFICGSISRILGVTAAFDSIVTRNGTKNVVRSGENPPKRLIDVETILKSIEKDSSNLAGRVYFFDDLHHEIEKELTNAPQYCLIKKWLPNDENNYTSVKKAMIPHLNLSSMKGGTVKCRSQYAAQPPCGGVRIASSQIDSTTSGTKSRSQGIFNLAPCGKKTRKKRVSRRTRRNVKR